MRDDENYFFGIHVMDSILIATKTEELELDLKFCEEHCL